jgi:chemotaxis protein MotB
MTPQPIQQRPIVIVRKRATHGGHHGGAWKVAYADFVTAMMALFIVLWLMNSSDHMRKAIAGYFNDPRGSTTTIGTDRAGAGEAIALRRDDLRDLKARLEQQVTSNPALVKLKKQIEITITPEGLRIELIESRDGTFFETGSAMLNENGRTTLTLLAHQLGQVPNLISVEGHTDARAYAAATGYGNWELSTDRANAARRLMEHEGLRTGQISQVRGFADRQLRVPSDPFDPSNRRISVIVHYLTQPSAMGNEDSAKADDSENHNPGAVTQAAASSSSPGPA